MSASIVARREVVAFMEDADQPHPNAIHSTSGARDYGFRGALIGGVTAYGWTVSTIVQALGEEWLDSGWVELRFRKPMHPGDALTVAVDATGTLTVHRSAELYVEAELCMEGRVGLGAAAWFPSLARPESSAPTAVEEKAVLSLEHAPVARDLASTDVWLGAAEASTFSREKERETLACFYGPRPRVHPAWLAEQPIRLLHHSYDYGPSIHTESLIQHLAPAHADQRIGVSGHCVAAFERKRHHYIVNDCLIADEGGCAVAALRHTAIFRVAAKKS